MTTIHFTGNLTRDPELRYTPGGKPVANLVVAENHRIRDTHGAWSDGPTTFWPVTVWGEPAEHVTETLTRGDRVVVIGRTSTRTWTPTDGANTGHEQRRLEVVADEVAPSLRWATATLTKTRQADSADTADAGLAGAVGRAGEDEAPF